MDVSDIKPNTKKYREEQQELANREKRVEQVVSGGAKLKKKSEISKFANTFISEDVKNVKSYIVGDVVIPAVKKIISEMITGAVNMILYGERGRPSSRSTGDKISYRSFYDQDKRQSSGSPSPRFEYDDISFKRRGDAEAVLDQLDGALERYGFVTIADYYDAAGYTAPFTAAKYGWTSLRDAEVKIDSDGYYIKFPKARPID